MRHSRDSDGRGGLGGRGGRSGRDGRCGRGFYHPATTTTPPHHHHRHFNSLGPLSYVPYTMSYSRCMADVWPYGNYVAVRPDPLGKEGGKANFFLTRYKPQGEQRRATI